MSFDCDVFIVGAGPVGLMLALDLAHRGIKVAIAETRPAGEPPSVKCNHVSSRTMEALRRLDLSRAVRAVGLPDDYPNDIVFRTTMVGRELARIPIPCRSDRYVSRDGPDTWWPTPEPPHRINQIYFEPIIFSAAQQHPNITIFNETRFDEAVDDAGVTVTLTHLPTGAIRTVKAGYMVGCDGGRSAVRKSIGARLEGDAVIQRVQSTLIDAPDLLSGIKGRPGWMNYNYNPSRSGTVIAIDGERRWLVHNYLRPDESDFDAVSREESICAILGIEAHAFTMVAKEDWIGRRLVANKLREGRIFIAGDAAHLWVPYAGYGMNAGIADALNLSWLLAAHIQGWAPETILDAYEAERLPITDQVSRFAMNYAAGAIRERNTVPPAIDDETPEGEAVRAELGARVYANNVQQFACAGLNYGYFYDASPIISYDGEPAPAYTMHDYTPSTVPGCRVPHFFVADGRSVYDLLGDGFAMMCFDRTVDLEPLKRAAARHSVPLKIVQFDRGIDDVPLCYRHALLLSRPDFHVGWRGDTIEDADRLIDLLRGAAV